MREPYSVRRLGTFAVVLISLATFLSSRAAAEVPEPHEREVWRAAPSSMAASSSPAWRADNNHVVAVRPDGKELYVFGWEESGFIFVVDLESPGLPVVAAIALPGVRPQHALISFSADSRRAFISRALQCAFEEVCGSSGDQNRILVIDTASRSVEFAIPMPEPMTPLDSIVPSPDGKSLFLPVAKWGPQELGIARVDLGSRMVTAYAPLEGVSFLAGSPDGRRLYASQGCNPMAQSPQPWCHAPNRFSVLDPESLAVLSSVSVDDGPRWIAVTPDGTKAYVSNERSRTTSSIDLVTMQAKSLAVGYAQATMAVTPDGTKVYETIPMGFAESGDARKSIAVIDARTDTILRTIVLSTEDVGIAIEPSGKRAFVPDGNANGLNPSRVFVLDVASDTFLPEITVRGPASVVPTAIDLTPDGRTLFVVSEAVGYDSQGILRNLTRLLSVDLPSRTVRASLPIQPRGVKVSEDGRSVLVFCEQELLVLDAVTLEKRATVNLKSIFPSYPWLLGSEAFRVVVNRAGDTAFLLGRSNEVLVVDLVKGTVSARIPFTSAPIRIARGLALTPDERKLFVSDRNTKSVAVIDTASRSVTARFPVDGTPSEIKISRDGQRAWVLQNTTMNMMTVVSTDDYSVVRKLSLPVSFPLDFELSADERFVYVPDFDPNYLIAFDVEAGKPERIVRTGLDPFNTVSSPDGRYVYVTNYSSDSISVFDTLTRRMESPIPLIEPAPVRQTLFVPVILSTAGSRPGAFFTSELTLTNRGSSDASVALTYTTEAEGAGGTATVSLAAGRQTVIPDAIEFLRSRGVGVGESGGRVGTLRVEFTGIAFEDAAAVTVRTTTPVPEGSAGLSYRGLRPSELLEKPVFICGLRQNATDRSNVAVVHAGAAGSGDIALRLTVFSGDPAAPLVRVLPDVSLSPGGFHQVSGILTSNGLSIASGFVKVERVAGSAPYYAYGVVNDQANSDGSFVEPVAADPPSAVAGLTLPALVETSTFSSELVVTNLSPFPRTLRCRFVSTALSGGSASFELTLLPFEQQILPAFVQVLRDRGVVRDAPGPAFAGALFSEDASGDARGLSVGARTSSRGGGGRYGVYYSATPSGAEAKGVAWLFGFQQDDRTRTNLTLVNTGSVDAAEDHFRIDLFDGAIGRTAGTIAELAVPARGFVQLGSILSGYAPAAATGYALVTRTAGRNPFIPYAVLNDGAGPGERSGDGAFVRADLSDDR